MSEDDIKFTNKKIDESWKDRIEGEKELSPEVSHAHSDPKAGGEEGLVSFSSLITSLAIQTLVYLGETEDPQQQKIVKNLEEAHNLIDLLIMLKEKTKNNLTPAETQLLDSALADLQFRFVQSSKSNV